MAATVKVIMNGKELLLANTGGNAYEATLIAPEKDGVYEILIVATSQLGKTASRSVGITVDNWTTPRIDWKPTDRFNIADFNRIRNNILAIINLMYLDVGVIETESMGEDLTDHTVYWNVDYFNAFEENIEIIQRFLPLEAFGTTQSFYSNGPFIKYDELNRIENLLLRYKQEIKDRKAGLRRLPFRLGMYREFRA